ncbi:MAG TPA: hypothetical protein VIH55_03440 [Acidimicrobiia bacterium]
MEQERNEVYERIPWERLEEKKNDRQWLMFGLAGAVVLGALAYSYMSNRPVAVTTGSTVPVAAETSAPPVGTEVIPPVAAPMASAPTATAPVVTAEADLYAVHPERVIDRVSAHAEWFVAEYLTVDGSDQATATLASLMPAGVPLPAAPEGARVFVEWVRTLEVEEVAPLIYRATVLARSLAATGEDPYQRQAPLEVVVDISVAGEGPQVVLPPLVRTASVGPAAELSLIEVPEEVGVMALEQTGGSEVVGGVQTEAGDWRVVVLAAGPDGVTRPVTVSMP